MRARCVRARVCVCVCMCVCVCASCACVKYRGADGDAPPSALPRGQAGVALCLVHFNAWVEAAAEYSFAEAMAAALAPSLASGADKVRGFWRGSFFPRVPSLAGGFDDERRRRGGEERGRTKGGARHDVMPPVLQQRRRGQRPTARSVSERRWSL